MNIELLLARADDGDPLLSRGLPLEAASGAPRPAEAPTPSHLSDPSADPNDLPAQRWGIIAPEGPEGDRLLDLVAPLRQARERSQGAKARVYRVAPEMDATAAVAWKDKVYWDDNVPEPDLPRYLLVLGDLDQVSLDLQQIMASSTFIGRLAVDTDQDYASYVDKVLSWERTPSEEPAARSVYCTVRDGTAATAVGYDALMAPSAAAARARSLEGRLPLKEVVDLALDPEDAREAFLDQTRRSEPTVLCTMSHGLGAPRRGFRSASEQRALQGAMSLGGGNRLAGEDLSRDPFLPGGIWFYLACYGGGTPRESAYAHWLSQLRGGLAFGTQASEVLAGLPKAHERPFIAALPKAVLANPKGPLGVIAHCDLAWTIGFRDVGPGGGSRASRFQGVFAALAKKARQGVAYHSLLRFFSEKSVELSVLYDEEARLRQAGKPAGDDAYVVKKANLWMARQDLSGYVLLGDPAARLPLASAKPSEALAPSRAAASVFGFAPQRAASAPARDAHKMEEAVMAVLSGEESEKAIAARHGVARSELTRWVEVYRKAGREALSRMT